MRRWLCLVGLSAGLLITPAQAGAAIETKEVNFDNLIAPEHLTTQYQPEGVVFAGPTKFGFEIHGHEPENGRVDQSSGCGEFTFVRAAPEIYAPSTTHSPPNDADITCGSEFYPAGTFMAFTNFAKKVSAYVGDQTSGEQFRLDAYDIERGLIGHTEVTTSTTGIETPIEFEAPSFEIAYVTIYRTNPAVTGSIVAGIDNLSFTAGGAPPAISLSASIPPQGIAQGAEVKKTVTVLRDNNSEGEVELKASGLPSGVTASFNPPVLNGTESTSTLTLSVAENAPLATATGTLEAIPKTAAAGTLTSKIPVTLAVVPPFSVFVGGASSVPASTTVAAAPCSTTPVKVRTQIEQGFAGPVTLALGASASAPDVTNLALEKSFLEPSDFGFVGQNEQTLRITRGEGPVGGSFHVSVVGTSGSFTEPAATVNVERAAPAIGNVNAKVGQTPRLGVEGTRLTITGAGFCPGAKVGIGNAGAATESLVTPESIGAGGTSLTFHVPRGAVTGPVEVVLPDGQRAAGPSVTVASFRNTYGFRWQNQDFGSRLNEQSIDEIFGKTNTNIEVFQLFGGWLVRKPEAYVFETVVNSNLEAGICFGAAFTSLVLSEFPNEALRYPHTGEANAWHLDSPGRPSELLLKELTKNFSMQYTDNLVGTDIDEVTKDHTAAEDLKEIKEGLAEGHPVIIGMIHWKAGGGSQGHAVLAYDTHVLPNGSTAVDIVNSNTPYSEEEETNPGVHDTNEFTNSEIIISNSGWEFPQGAEISESEGKPWTGPYGIPAINVGKLVVFKQADLPYINGKPPKLPNILGRLGTLFFGSASDGVTELKSGKQSLIGAHEVAAKWPSGVAPLNTYSGTGASKQLQILSVDPHSAAPLTATVKRSPGGGQMVMDLPGLQAVLNGGAHTGQLDHVSVNPGTDNIGYQTNLAHASLTGSLLAAPGVAAGDASAQARSATTSLLEHVAQFQITSGGGRRDDFSFPTGKELVVAHQGPAATVTVTLSALVNGQPVAVRLSPLHLGAGATLKVAPTSWSALGSTGIRVKESGRGHRSSRIVHGTVLGRRFATLRKARLVKQPAAHRYLVQLALKLHHAPAHGWLSAAVQVVRHGHVVEHAAPVQIAGPALAKGKLVLALPKPLGRGHYKLVVHLLEAVASGPAQASRTVSQSVGVSAG